MLHEYRTRGMAFVAALLIPASVVVLFGAQLVFAQAGTICLFADSSGATCSLDDSAPGLLKVYVIHTQSPGSNAVEFYAPKPACMIGATWLADSSPFPVTIGDSQNGVAVGYGTCLPSPIHVLTIHYAVSGVTTPDCAYSVLASLGRSSIEVVDCNSVLRFAAGGTTYVNSGLACDCIGVVSPPVLYTNPLTLSFTQTELATEVEVLQIRNFGDSPLNWTVGADVSWLSFDQASGTNDAAVTVTADRSGLPTATYTGTITVSSNGGNTTVNVFLTVELQDPLLFVNPTSLDFGETSTAQTFEIHNIGAGTLTWNITESLPWLSVLPASGTGDAVITVTVDRSSGAAGVNTGIIDITWNGGSATVNVTMIVSIPVLSVSPTSLDFGPSSTLEALTITNAGTGTLTWNLAETISWLTAAPSSGTNNGVVPVVIDRTGLAPGSYAGVIDVTSNGGVETVTVTMTIPSPGLNVTPLNLDFGATTTTLSFLITNGGGSILTWNVAETIPWLIAVPPSGTNDEAVNVTVDRLELPVGNHSGVIDVTSNGGNETVTVTMTVPPPGLAFSPTMLTFAPSVNVLPLGISNTGGGTLGWFIGSSQPWVSVSPDSGVGGAQVSVTVDRGGFGDGTFNAELTIGSSGGNGTVPITMEVATNPILSVTPAVLNFSPSFTTDAFVIENTGVGTLTWSLSADQPWIDIVPPISGSGDATVTVNVDLALVPAGVLQTGNISVTSSGGGGAVEVRFSRLGPAQVGAIGVYADPGGLNCFITDAAPGLLTVYVVHTLMPGVTASQFSAPAPACMIGATWLSDTPVFPATVGNSQNGVTVGYGVCLGAPIHVLTINYFGQGSSQTCCSYPVLPDPNVASGRIEGVDCVGQFGFGTGQVARVNGDPTCSCGQVPVEETTWGRLKAMYVPKSIGATKE